MIDTRPFILPAGISVLLSVGTVYLGKEIQDESIDEKLVISGGFIILTIAIINYYSQNLADAFAFLIFIGLLLKYGIDILRHSGLQSG